MKRLLVVAVFALGLVLAGRASALAKTTPDFTFQSDGSASQPGAVAGTGAAGTYQDFPFTIASDDADGSASIGIQWANQFDDFDLYVYRKAANGDLEQVGSSAGGPPSTQENVVLQATKDPIPPGSYVIRVQNYAATSPNFTGFAKFGAFQIPNVPPTAVFKAPATAVAGQTVTLDGSGSTDPDGHIVGYAWDLDGDGAMDVSSASPTLQHAFSAGRHHVTLRVTDNTGARAYANATINVTPRTKGVKKHHSKKRTGHRHV